VKTRLGRWLLLATGLFLLYVNIQQAATIAEQKHQLVETLKTLIASQNEQVSLHQQLLEAQKSCQK